MAIRGGDWGGLDGLDVWGENIWIHDVCSDIGVLRRESDVKC